MFINKKVFKNLIKNKLPRNIINKLNIISLVYLLILFLVLIVILDNNTRQNSTYLFIEKAVALKAKIRVYSKDYKEKLGEDFITLINQDVICELK